MLTVPSAGELAAESDVPSTCHGSFVCNAAAIVGRTSIVCAKPSSIRAAPLSRQLDEERHERDVGEVARRDVATRPPSRKLSPWSAVTITSARS